MVICIYEVIELLLNFNLKEIPTLIKTIKRIQQLRAHIKQLLQTFWIMIDLFKIVLDGQIDTQLLFFHFFKVKVDLRNLLIKIIKHIFDDLCLQKLRCLFVLLFTVCLDHLYSPELE